MLQQTFSDYELIIINDGSTDATEEAVNSLNDKRIRYFYQKNQGPAQARNRAIKKAKGKFICFLDSDDRFVKEKLEVTYSYIKKYPQYAVFHSEEIWYRSGRLLSPKSYHQKPSGFVFENAVKLCCLSLSTAVIRKDVFEEIGFFDENMPACEDYDFWLRVTARYPVFLIPEYLTIKEGGHLDQQSKKYPAMDKFRIYALEKILKTLPKENNNYLLAYEELKRKTLIYLRGAFNFTPNKNQLQEIERLIFEISRREASNPLEIVNDFRKNNFSSLKKSLIERRFPLTSRQQQIDPGKVFLNQVPLPLGENYQPEKVFKPEKILVEKEAMQSQLLKNFKNRFPEVEIEEISLYRDYLKQHKFSLSELKKPFVFIVKERWDFLKPCPCTKNHISCGYWILNLGFGCPYDCSYCFLQHYTNSQGIVLPANLEDFFAQFDKFSKKLKQPIRIGTGEFCDSLALDDLTGYSKQLIPYFSKKNVLFELKTKSVNIENLLKLKPPQNIIISWSLNTKNLALSEELAAPGLDERLWAAGKIQSYGYRVGFHFDPIIYSQTWENRYQDLVKSLYQKLKPPFAWISLGTLRCHRQLKTTTEQRFLQSNIFYGELLLGEDKKLCYPEFLRKEIYQKMVGWIRKYDAKTPIYLCMENKNLWKSLGKDLSIKFF